MRGFSTVKLDQQLLTFGVSAAMLPPTYSPCRAELNLDACKLSRSQVQPVISGKADCHYKPPAASLSWPDVCHRQMMSKRLRGWRALRKTQEERGDCLRPMVLTGLSFNSICSITAVCVEPHSIGWQIQETQKKQAFSLWFGQWTCSKPAALCDYIHFKEHMKWLQGWAPRIYGLTWHSKGWEGNKKQPLLTSDAWIYGHSWTLNIEQRVHSA